MERFHKGQPLRAADLNAIIDAIMQLIVPGQGIRITRAGQQVVVSAAMPARMGGGSSGGGNPDVVEAEVTVANPGENVFTATWNNGAADQTIQVVGAANGLSVGDQVSVAYVPDADDGAMKWVVVGNLFKTPVAVGSANAEGDDGGICRSDHVHQVPTGTPVDVALANAAGSASTFAKSDHVHKVPTAAATTVSNANAEGTASTFARSDHTHNVIPRWQTNA